MLWLGADWYFYFAPQCAQDCDAADFDKENAPTCTALVGASLESCMADCGACYHTAFLLTALNSDTDVEVEGWVALDSCNEGFTDWLTAEYSFGTPQPGILFVFSYCRQSSS